MLRATMMGLLALTLWLGAGPGPLRAEDPVGFVVAQSGATDLERGGQKSRLHLGTKVYLGDLIETETDSRVELELYDGSRLAIGADSQVRLKHLVLKEQSGFSGAIELLIGLLRATLTQGDQPRQFEIRSRTAVASVRSTDWIVEASPDNTAVFVVSGQVAVTSTAGDVTVDLEPDYGTDVPLGGAPSQPKRWGQGRVERTLSRITVP